GQRLPRRPGSSTATSSAGSSKRKSLPTLTSWPRVAWRPRRRRARYAWKARTTSCRTATWSSSASTFNRQPSAVGSRLDRLQRPRVAVGIAEVDEVAPRLRVDLARLDAGRKQGLAGSRGIGHDDLNLLRAR